MIIFIFRKKYSKIKKVLTVFSILNKIFLKIDGLMYALRVHINQTQKLFIYYNLTNKKSFYLLERYNKSFS